jgi:hypothetical protein
MRRLLIQVVHLALLWSLVPAGLAAGQSITIGKLVDSFDALPDDPTATFTIPGGPGGAPALDRDTVVFKAQPAFTGFQLLWAGNLSSGTFTRLGDQNTPIPDGQGMFIDYQPFMASAGNVVFRGNGGPGNQQAGLYVVSARGGTILTLVNQDTPIPEGTGTFPAASSFLVFSLDGANAVFAGNAGAGLYAVSVTGGPPRSIHHNTFICELGYGVGGINIFTAPSMSGDTVATVVGNVSGEAAVYTLPLGGIVGIDDPCAAPQLRASNVTRVASLNVPVPGDSQGRNFDPRSFGIALIDRANIVFGGAAGPDLVGIYGLTPDGLVNLVDTNTPVPGGTGTFQSFPGSPLAAFTLNGGNVVFRGFDASGTEGLYMVPAAGGTVVKVVAVGDTLSDGRTVIGNGGGFFQPPIQTRSLSGNQLAFRIDFSDPIQGSGNGIYLALIQ